MAYVFKKPDGTLIVRPITHPATDEQVNAQLRALSESGQLQIETKRNLKITAHRGYHVDVPQNTLASFVAAVDNGFEWLEIDVHKTQDGVYVLGHNSTVTLYNNGVATSVTWYTSNYSDIKDYTWDAEGEYPLGTLSQALNLLKVYNAKVIIDRKSGSTADIVKEISQSGMADDCFISFDSAASAVGAIDLLNQFNTLGARVITTENDDLKLLATSTSNPILADVNANTLGSNASVRKALSIALSVGVPIMFSGCTLSNKKVWNVIASGVMANDDANIPYSTFLDEFKHDMDVSDITCATDDINLALSDDTTITATTDTDAPMCYIFAYPFDASIVDVEQLSFGNNISVKITGIKVGNTKVRLFTGSGTHKDIDVIVS